MLWFIALLALLMSFVLVLASSIHFYLFARVLKDYSEELALSAKALQLQGKSLEYSRDLLGQYLVMEAGVSQLTIETKDGKTIEVGLCAYWHSPISLLVAEKSVCQKSLAR